MKRNTSNPTRNFKVRVSGKEAENTTSGDEFSEFARLTQRLIAVPKEEVDAKRAAADRPSS